MRVSAVVLTTLHASTHRHEMEVNGQLRTPTALPSVTTDKGLSWSRANFDEMMRKNTLFVPVTETRSSSLVIQDTTYHGNSIHKIALF
jgi:hypothetical protein